MGSKQIVKRLENGLDFQKGPKKIAKRICAKRFSVHFEVKTDSEKIEKGDPNGPIVSWK